MREQPLSFGTQEFSCSGSDKNYSSQGLKGASVNHIRSICLASCQSGDEIWF